MPKRVSSPYHMYEDFTVSLKKEKIIRKKKFGFQKKNIAHNKLVAI